MSGRGVKIAGIAEIGKSRFLPSVGMTIAEEIAKIAGIAKIGD
jgi:hypothetical protein